MQFILICGEIQEEDYIWGVDSQSLAQQNRRSTQMFTETGIEGVEDFKPAICWTQYFIVAQGYNIRDNHLHEYNNSSILFEKNGKALIIKRTKHIKIRYLFITDRVKNGELSVV